MNGWTTHAYGVARHHPKFDLDADGDVDGDDVYVVTTVRPINVDVDIDDAAYQAEADIDRNGVVDGDDYNAIVGASSVSAISDGLISDPDSTTDNQIGYDGYVFNAETKQYSVRFRTFDPGLGRWIERDPVQYADCENLYEYTCSKPIIRVDPSGLYGITTRSKRLSCTAWQADGYSKWELESQSLARSSPISLPTPQGWAGVALKIWGLFQEPRLVHWVRKPSRGGWEPLSQRPGDLDGVTCRCDWIKKIRECRDCCYQDQVLQYRAFLTVSMAYYVDKGDPYQKRECRWETSMRQSTYGTLYWNSTGDTFNYFKGYYSCDCLKPSDMAVSLAIALENSEIPEERIEDVKRKIRELGENPPS